MTSEFLERFKNVSRLPIFPLPLVMLPNELLPLHIFEPRYRQMLIDIEKHGNVFGVIHFDPEGPFEERPAPGAVGCLAEVRESELLADGRSNILALGVVRFRLVSYEEAETPYLTGEVEAFADEDRPSKKLTAIADEAFALFERMAKAAFRLSGGRGTVPEIQRADPEALSFLITAAFNFDNKQKYSLLETTSTYGRLRELRSILKQAVEQFESNADIQSVAKTNGHARKKLDL